MAPPSLREIFAYASNFAAQLPLSLTGVSNPFSALQGHGQTPLTSPVTPYVPLSGAPTCPLDGPLSCHNSTQADACCFVYPGGRLLQTQFWDDVVRAGGNEEDWTVHGLWPDLCDGSYDQFCNMSPQFHNITEILKNYGQDDLLEDMNRYWVSKDGVNSNLWDHEYNKHGTCINTLAPSCYGDSYTPGLEVVDYFVRAFGLFRMLDTYRALEREQIVPSATAKYSLAHIQETLEEFSGGRVVLRCEGPRHDILHEAWYVYFVKGSLQSGDFVPAKDSFKGDHTNCAATVRYLPKKAGRTA